MSYAKDRKIRKLKRKRLWPRIVTMIITDIGILIFTGLITYLAVIGIVGTNFLTYSTNNEKILNSVNEKWNKSNTRELDARIQSMRQAFDNIQGVYVTNSEFQIIKSYGKSAPDLNNILNFKKAKRMLDRGNPYTKMVENDEDDFNVDVDIELETFEIFHRFLNFFNSSKRKEYVEWANKKFATRDFWSVYNTDFPGVYVCINNAYVVNNFQLYFFYFLITIFVVVFILCFSYHIIRLIVYILEAIKIDMLISTDWVTGGRNKNWFIEKGRIRIRGNRKKWAVVQIRLQKYRNYCTTYGVKQGENLLELIDNQLENFIHGKEIVAHIEKSDFALLLTYDDKNLLNKRINLILKRLTEVRENQHLLFVAGCAEVTYKASDINALLSASGLALVQADDTSTDIIWFNDAMKEEQVWERHVEDDMEKALENHEFQLYLQPKYSTKGEYLAAAEALVRWIHPKLGFISPGKFIPIFEKNGFILKLDDYMLTEVAKQQAKWMREGKQLVPISVNVSRAHFTKDDLAEHICKIVDVYKVPHKYIELELTESAFFDDKEVLLKTVRKLKAFGFAISMDDFGAGYSSLNSLKELPLDVIKLDAEFFRGQIDDANRANLIVSDTISLAKKLGMQIVAEGIETREQVDFLAGQNCDLIQGFYFAKPLPVKEFEERAYPSKKA